MAGVRYVTVLQLAPATAKAMDAVQQLSSSDGLMEGAQLGNRVVLFGRDGDLKPSQPVTYLVTANGSVSHLLTNLPPGQKYQVKTEGAVLTTATATAQGIVSFTTPAGRNRTVELLPAR